MGKSKDLFIEVRQAEELDEQPRQALFGPSAGDYARQVAKLKERIAEYEQAELKILEFYSRACRNYHSSTDIRRDLYREIMGSYRDSLECLYYTSVQLDQISTDAYNAVNFSE